MSESKRKTKENILEQYKTKKHLNETNYLDLLDELSDLSDDSIDLESDLESDSDTDNDDIDSGPVDIDSNNSIENMNVDADRNEWNNNNDPPRPSGFTASPGIQVHIPNTPLGFIQLFLTRELCEYFMVQTNNYAKFRRENGSSVYSDWTDVSLSEIMTYMGLVILFGIYYLPRLSMYWSPNQMYHSPLVPKCMTFRRFKQINAYFHACDNDKIDQDNTDRLIKVRPIIEYFLHKFKKTYTPDKDLCIDEGVLAFKGRLNFKVYNKDKPDKYGIKLYILAESLSGYVSNFDVYCGKGKTTKEIVNNLMTEFCNHGYRLYMHNFYNSVQLSQDLLKKISIHVGL